MHFAYGDACKLTCTCILKCIRIEYGNLMMVIKSGKQKLILKKHVDRKTEELENVRNKKKFYPS